MQISDRPLCSLLLHRLFAVQFLITGGLFLGCSGSISVPATVPVKGVVKYKGKPCLGIRVTFHNETTSKGFIPTGETGPDGNFVLSTGEPHNGAPPGNYVVTFVQPMLDPNDPVETEIDGFHGKYSDPMESKWTVTIERGDNSLQPFELN